MYNWHQYPALLVVAVQGPHDITRTTWPEAPGANRHVKKLVQQGVSAANIRVYRRRL